MEAKTYPHKVLIIEDEAPMLKALADNLHAAGFVHVVQSRDGADGLMLALAEQPDLIILDLIMPKMDGMTMLKKLREDQKGKALKVILLTNLTGSDEKIMNSVVEGEPSYYLVKTSHSISDVIDKVKIVLGIEQL